MQLYDLSFYPTKAILPSHLSGMLVHSWGQFSICSLTAFFFIFLDEPDGALRGFIFSSFLFWVILHDCWSLLIQSVHFASLPLVPLSQRSWFLIWILGIFVGYVFFIIWKRTVSYKKVAIYLPIFNKYSNNLNCT